MHALTRPRSLERPLFSAHDRAQLERDSFTHTCCCCCRLSGAHIRRWRLLCLISALLVLFSSLPLSLFMWPVALLVTPLGVIVVVALCVRYLSRFYFFFLTLHFLFAPLYFCSARNDSVLSGRLMRNCFSQMAQASVRACVGAYWVMCVCVCTVS